MKFSDCPLADARIIELTSHVDSRGAFSRIYCEKEFDSADLGVRFVQANLSQNPHAFTLRGLHKQITPYEEDKLVCCVNGAIWDAIVDLRPQSPTFMSSFGIELKPESGRMLLIPKGFAHGFLTLSPNTVVVYQVSYPYTPNAERGYRWNDPAFNIEWPAHPRILSEKDEGWPDFSPPELAA